MRFGTASISQATKDTRSNKICTRYIVYVVHTKAFAVKQRPRKYTFLHVFENAFRVILEPVLGWKRTSTGVAIPAVTNKT